MLREFERSGVWLFRWRSYIPLVLLPMIFVAAFRYPLIDAHPGIHFTWSIACFSITLLGLLVRCHTVGHAPAGTSGRNRKQQNAEGLNTSGFYSIVRHPLYLGNFLIAFGFVLHSVAPWLIALYVTTSALYYERIIVAEESFLGRKFGVVFTKWADNTPTFLPRCGLWRSEEQPMDWSKMIRAESAAAAVIALAFATLEHTVHWSQSTKFSVEVIWYVLLVSGALIYLIGRLMKRHFRWWTKYEAILNDAAK